jgi:hypothetical protein
MKKIIVFMMLIVAHSARASQRLYRPSDDKEECRKLRNMILANLHNYNPKDWPPAQGQCEYLNCSIEMFAALKCNRFEDNYN